MSIIITGEKIQQLCDIYLGLNDDFIYNPIISIQIEKHKDLNSINEIFDNPFKIFCYTHNIELLSTKIHLFKNPFILITHNSDYCVNDNVFVNTILNKKLLIKWFCQNLSYKHEKLELIPIGLANSMWKHGNLDLFNDTNFINNIKKNKLTYFNFSINTNKNKRQCCYDKLNKKIEWLNTISPDKNLKRLSEYKFCICPEGNGYDTHRLWECLYLKVVPIVKDSEFTKILIEHNIPIVVLNEWDDYNENILDYEKFNFDTENFSIHKFDKMKEKIMVYFL